MIMVYFGLTQKTERSLFWTLKYEEIYIKEYNDVKELKKQIKDFTHSATTIGFMPH